MMNVYRQLIEAAGLFTSSHFARRRRNSASISNFEFWSTFCLNLPRAVKFLIC